MYLIDRGWMWLKLDYKLGMRCIFLIHNAMDLDMVIFDFGVEMNDCFTLRNGFKSVGIQI